MNSTSSKIQAFANLTGWTDVLPYEVGRIVSDKCVEVRPMQVERDPQWQPNWKAGGFAGHCVNNNEQKWVITSDPTVGFIRIRLGKQGWKDKAGNMFVMSDRPIHFHDFNF